LNALLIRVAADLSSGGGSWNGPVDSQSNEFAYVAIPEFNPTHPGYEKPYSVLRPVLARFKRTLPTHLAAAHIHLDPDFEHLTYGDSGQKAAQIQRSLGPGDYAVFYAGLRDIRGAASLLYGIIGILEVDAVVPATTIGAHQRDINAHSRRVLESNARDVVVVGRPRSSGRLAKCLPIGEYRDRAYRVRRDLLDAWGGLNVKDGYVQRSARIPSFRDPNRFLGWFSDQSSTLLQANNPAG
jgi:Nucleotide modification associated domain 3